MQPFPCQACRVFFPTGLEFRAHFKSPWHHYNLQRKLVSLEPLSQQEFESRAESVQLNSNQERLYFLCSECRRTYKSKNAFLNHSKKCKGNVKVVTQQERDAQEVLKRKLHDERVAQEKPLTEFDCLFCPTSSRSVDENFSHMKRFHGLHIHREQFLVDRVGLLQYLATKISVGHACLFCYRTPVVDENCALRPGRIPSRRGMFRSIEAVREHMRSKSHMKIHYLGGDEEEYEDFYGEEIVTDDDAGSQDIVDHGGDDEWEDMSDESDLEDARFEEQTMELVLPDKRLGHRSLRVYYKQRLRPHPPESESLFSSSNNQRLSLSHKLKNSRTAVLDARRHPSKLSGGLIRMEKGSGGAVKKQVVEREAHRIKKELAVSVRANHQKHFRPQVIF